MAQLAPAQTVAPVPPQNLEAEESILGAMMISQAAIGAVSEIVDAGDFYRESHSKIYRAALALYSKGEAVDVITLTDELDERGELEQVGGRVRLHELAALVPATANVSHWARVVRELATLRGLIRVGGEVSKLGWERPAETPQLVDQAQQLIFDVALQRSQTTTVSYEELLRETYDRLVELYESGAELTGLASGLRDLDELTGGFQPQQLVIVGGRPSMGKSALATTIARNVASAGNGVAIFSLEMSARELAERFLAAEAKLDLRKLRRPSQLSAPEWQRLIAGADRQRQLSQHMHIHELNSVDALTLRSEARRLKARHPQISLLIVDYIQLAEANDRRENRNQEIGEIVRGLKQVARDLEITVLALSQLNRAVENRADKRPTMADLRESGELEQAADLILLLYRDDYYHEESEKQGIAEVNVAKHRNGPTGTIDLAFQKRHSLFSDLAKL